MRRFAAVLAVLVLVAAACGDDDSVSEDTTATTTATTAASSTTAAPATTTTAAPTTTEEPANPAMEMALQYEGTYEGEWSNTTFGSSGPIAIEVEVDEGSGVALIRMDLGGNVFGLADPDPIVWEVDLIAGEFFSGDDLFGETTAGFGEDGSFSLEAPAVPGLGGIPMTIAGQAGPDGFSGTYSIPGLAEGTFEASPSA